jgi:NADH oxidase (H2O2-forming)
MKIVIIGGGSAGTTCAFEIRKRDKNAEIIVLEKSKYTQYSPCALPYLISGEIEDINNIFIFKEKDYKENNIKLKLNTIAKEIDNKEKTVICESKEIGKEEIDYDKLVIAVGSESFVPEIKGIEKVDYFLLKNIEDTKKIIQNIKPNTTSIVIGAGLVGVELAISLAKKGENVVLVEMQDYILKSMFDADIAQEIKKTLEELNIKIIENQKILAIDENKKLILENERIEFEKIFVCTGVKSKHELAGKINLKLGKGIVVDEFLRTSNQDIYACGDAVESVDFITKQKVMSQLGTTAVRQAKVIAKNVWGVEEKFKPVLNNTVTKLENLFVACVGINTEKAKEIGVKIISAKYKGHVRSEYYPSKSMITIKIMCDMEGKILGGQIIGNEEVVGRINLLALAIEKEMKVEELMKLETCYNPASAPIFDPITITAEICNKKVMFMKK